MYNQELSLIVKLYLLTIILLLLKLKVTCALVSLFTEIRILNHYKHCIAVHFELEIKLEVNCWLKYLLVFEFSSPKRHFNEVL